MTYDSLSLSELIPAPPERIYAAWLSSDEHSAFTGDRAVVEPFVGGKHSTFDGYAVGHTVELQPGHRIVQTWRAEDFPLGSPDSRVEVTLEETVGGTMVTILHTEIPRGQGSSCRDGWLKYYLEALKGYFIASKPNGVLKRAPKIAAAAKPTVTKPKAAPTKVATAKKVTAKKAVAKVRPSTAKAKPAAKKKTTKNNQKKNPPRSARTAPAEKKKKNKKTTTRPKKKARRR